MKTAVHHQSFLKLPLTINYAGRRYTAEIIGKIIPFNKYFTCIIPGEDLIIMEAVTQPSSTRLSWKVSRDNKFAHLMPMIGSEIEKHLA